LADDASNFILLSGSTAGDGANYEQMELMAATGDFNYYRVGRTDDAFSISTTATGDASLQVLAYPIGGGVTYHLIDKAGKLVMDIESKSTAVNLPDAWKSPLVSTYHYYSSPGYDSENSTYTPTDAIGTAEIDPSTTPNIYVTYEANNDVKFFDPESDEVGTTYMLKFYGGESFKQEDGKDGVEASPQKAEYPYSNGDAMLFVYSDTKRTNQFNSGASTRPRWLWYVESPNNDPYRVKIRSHSGQVSSNNYFRTYAVEYGGATHIVTGVTTKHEAVDAEHAIQLPSEYMILNAPNNRYKLVTVNEISLDINRDGDYDDEREGAERRTVNTFEQYWKNNPTIQKLLGNAKVTEEESYSDNIILTPEQKSLLPSKWHTCQAFANAAPWLGWKTDDTGSGKKYKNKNHWFQTIDMGSTGEFTFEATTVEPKLNHLGFPFALYN
jgi:hypothetical protein